MDKIVSLEQYKVLTAEAKKAGCQLSNCFFLAPEIKKKTASGSLCYTWTDQGLLLLEDCGAFFRCYYYFRDDMKPESVQLEKDAVIELPFNAQLNEKQLRQIEMIEGMGFRLGRESSLMRLSVDDIKLDLPANEQCDYALLSDSDEIMRLLYESFNPLYAFLPTADELAQAIEKKSVFVVRDGEQAVGVLLSSIGNNTAIVHHLAVNPLYRGKGLGKYLLDFYHKKYKTDVAVFQHWVDINYHAVIHMYQKFGYEFASRKANEYIYTI